MKGVSPLPTTGHTGFSHLVVCTKEKPFYGPSSAGTRVRHTKGPVLGANGGGTSLGCVSFQCPHCGFVWEEPLP